MMRREWTLSEAARLLDEPQHRLIYLCEKGVVIPDYGDAEGRGSSRRFSSRNLVEFAVALKLMELTISASTAAAIVYVLRVFAKSVGEITGFDAADSLRKRGAPELRIIISDGERLYFSLSSKNKRPKLFGGINFPQLASGGRKRVSEREANVMKGGFGGPEGSRYARIEINVTQLAKDLPLEA
jgi:hypothetical protein